MTPKTNADTIIYSPNDIVSYGTRYLDERRTKKHQAIPLGLPSIDADFLPLLPGELCSIIGRPGNGKTGLMMAWARNRARWLLDNGLNDRVVVYATWEQSIEELYAFNVSADSGVSITEMARGNVADGDWAAILTSGSRRLKIPLWFIGHSIARRKARPSLTMTDFEAAVRGVEDWRGDEGRFTVDMIFVDYLQRIKFEGRVESKTIGVSDNLDRCKDLALSTGCPVVVGVQAVRDVDRRDDPTPQMDDGQWTSNIEQASDAVLSLVRPAKYRSAGEMFPGEGGLIVTGNSQMFFKCCKRKLGPDNWGKWIDFDPRYNRLDEAEVKTYDFKND